MTSTSSASHPSDPQPAPPLTRVAGDQDGSQHHDGARQSSDHVEEAKESKAEPAGSPSTRHEVDVDDEKHHDAAAATQQGKKTSKIPAWVTDNVKNVHSLKMLFRCWLVSWVAIIVILPDRSLQTLGQASFFVCMVTVFLPANMPVFIWLIANTTLVLGACVGWAWGCAAMAAANSARDNALLQSQIQRIVAGAGSGATNPEASIQAAVFQAAFLDPKASTVYGVFLAIGSYAFGVLFVKSQKLRFFAIFGTIVLDILCTYGPLFPTQQYTLGTIFLLPIGVSLGISFAGMLFIFPETLSYVWQGKLSGLFKATLGFVKLHDQFLDALTHSDNTAATVREYSAKLRASMAGQVALFELLDGQKGFLHMEPTYSALSARDLISFVAPLREFTLRAFGLLAFNNALETRLDAENDDADQTEKAETQIRQTHDSKSSEEDELKRPVRVQETELLTRLSAKMRQAEEEQHVNLERDLLPIMIDSSRDLLAKASAAVGEITSWLDHTNEHRYFKQYSSEQHLDTAGKLLRAADELEAALEAFERTERLKLIAPYESHFKLSEEAQQHVLGANGARSFRLGAQSLFFCLTWCANILEAGRALARITHMAHSIAVKRPKSKLWWPTGLRKLGHLLLSHKGSDAMHSLPSDAAHANDSRNSDDTALESADVFDEEATAASDDHDHENSPDGKQGQEDARRAKHEAEKAHKKEKLRLQRLAQRDADALPPTNLYHRFGRFMAACYHFFWSPVGLFALRYTIAGFVLWIPSVATQTSASFSYANRGIWGIIMAQLAVSLTHGEQVFSLVSRVFGTVIGALIGAAMWYISTGNGNGNPYGFGAVTAVGFLPFVFLRIFAPMQYLIASLMTFVTLILVVGYSWQDTGRLTVSVNSGIGIVVAYRRMLLVMVGIGVGVVVMLFPKPPSTRTAARLNFAKSTQKKILRLYSSIIEAWAIQDVDSDTSASAGAEEPHGKSEAAASTNHALVHHPSLSNFRAEMFSAYELVKNLQMQVMMAKLDLQARGKWPGQRYEQLLKTHSRMLGALGQLYATLNEPSYDAEWRKRFAHMTALLDPATISDICLTLSLLGQALQTGTRLPHAMMFVRERALRSFNVTVAIERKLQEQGNPMAVQPLSLRILKSRQFMTHVQGTVALTTFLANLDEAMSIVRNLVGEEPLMGYENLQRRWEQRAFLLDP